MIFNHSSLDQIRSGEVQSSYRGYLWRLLYVLRSEGVNQSNCCIFASLWVCLPTMSLVYSQTGIIHSFFFSESPQSSDWPMSFTFARQHCATFSISATPPIIHTYHAQCPPSTTILLPVQKVDASEVSHVTTPRSSPGLAIRPSGFKRDHSSSTSGCASRNVPIIRVCT